ncbi:NUDIX domain-containing protein [uncultured Methanobrevibacter sp.]|uniref:NUDIX hydrolase n=1 Tax=uncultured Methanobrevibacter sp. TaxID=253161 RepID=UPI00262332D6
MTEKKDWGLTVRGVVKKEEKILILKRHPKSRNNPQKWELPGGKVDPGEFFDDALVRELKEETSLDVEIESLFETVEDRFISRRTHQYINTVQLMMNLEIISGEVQISDEHEDFKWVSAEELKELYNEDMLTGSLRSTLEKKNFNI